MKQLIKGKNKSILFVTPYFPKNDGIAKYASQFIREMEKFNISCKVLSFNGESYVRRFFEPLIKGWKILFSKYDYIYVHYAFFIYFIFLLPFLAFSRKKIIIEVHEFRQFLPFGAIIKYFDILYCRCADHIIVQNKKQYDALKQYGFKNLHMIYMPVDSYTLEHKYKQKIPEVTLLLHGFITRKKGYDIGIRALKLLPPQYKLVILGKPHDQTFSVECKTLIKELGLENRIEIIDKFVPTDEYEKRILDADILLYPYNISTASAALAEGALKFEKAFITSDLDSFTDYIGTSGNYFMSGDHHNLADKIQKLDFKKSVELSSHLKKEYSWDNAGKKLIEILN